MPPMSHVRKVGAGKAFAYAGPPPISGKAICLSGSGKAFGLLGVPIGVEGGPVGCLSWPPGRWPARCE